MNNQYKVIINSKLLSEKNSVGGFFSDVLDATFGVGGMLGPTREEKAEADEAIKGGYKSIYAYRKAQEEKAAKENAGMRATSPEEATIGRAMAVGQSLKQAQETGKIPVGTLPGQVKELPYTADLSGGGTSTELMKLQQQMMGKAVEAGATPEQLQVAAGPSSDVETFNRLGTAAQDLMISAGGMTVPKGQRTGGIRYNPKTGEINLPSIQSSAREQSAANRAKATRQKSAELGLDQSFAVSNPDFYRAQPVVGQHKTLTGTPIANSLQTNPYQPQEFVTAKPETPVNAPGLNTARSGLFTAMTSKTGQQIGRGLVAGQLITGMPTVSVSQTGRLSMTPPVTTTPEQPATSRSSSGQSLSPGSTAKPVSAAVGTAKSVINAVANSPAATTLVGGKNVAPAQMGKNTPVYLQQVTKPGLINTAMNMLGNAQQQAAQTTQAPQATQAPQQQPAQAAQPSQQQATQATQTTQAAQPQQQAAPRQASKQQTAQQQATQTQQQVSQTQQTAQATAAAATAAAVAKTPAAIKSPANNPNTTKKQKPSVDIGLPAPKLDGGGGGGDFRSAATDFKGTELSPFTIKIQSNLVQNGGGGGGSAMGGQGDSSTKAVASPQAYQNRPFFMKGK